MKYEKSFGELSLKTETSTKAERKFTLDYAPKDLNDG